MASMTLTEPLVSRRNARRCGCGNWFNAWSDRQRDRCYHCAPLRPKVAERLKRMIDHGVVRL